MVKTQGRGIKNLEQHIHNEITRKANLVREETVADIRSTLLSAKDTQSGLLRRSEINRKMFIHSSTRNEYPNVDTERFVKNQDSRIDGISFNTAQITFFNEAQSLRGQKSYYAAKLEERNNVVRRIWNDRSQRNLAILTSGAKRTVKK